jgi:hypothetical protein
MADTQEIELVFEPRTRAAITSTRPTLPVFHAQGDDMDDAMANANAAVTPA